MCNMCVLSAPGGGDCPDAPDPLLPASMLVMGPGSMITSAVPAAPQERRKGVGPTAGGRLLCARCVCLLSSPGGGDCSDASDPLLPVPMLVMRPGSMIIMALPAAPQERRKGAGPTAGGRLENALDTCFECTRWGGQL